MHGSTLASWLLLAERSGQTICINRICNSDIGWDWPPHLGGGRRAGSRSQAAAGVGFGREGVEGR